MKDGVEGFPVASRTPLESSPEIAEFIEFLTRRPGMGQRIAAFDWRRTSLGPISGWPKSLLTVIRIMLTSRYAMWMAWGPDLIFFCNDAYLPTVGIKRDWVLGSRSDKVWEEIWPEIGPRIDHVLKTGEATWDESLLLFLERSGYPEETYHTFSYSPLADDFGAITGMLCVVTEVTQRHIGERRLGVLRDLGLRLAGARTLDDVKHAVIGCLQSQPRDVPFSLTYLFDDQMQIAELANYTGLPAGQPAAPASLPIGADRGFWPFAAVLETGAAQDVDLSGAFDFPADGVWGRASTKAIALPIAQQGQASPSGVFIAGLNPYRPADESYLGFLSLFAGQVAAAIAAARSYEAERRRAEALAELDRAKTAFFSNVSHEFRTPLTLMLGPLEDLLSSADGRERTQLELVHRNGLRLLRLVNTLLDFSRIEAGRAKAAFAPLHLGAFVANIASNFRSATERAGLTLDVQAEPLGEPVWADSEMVEKVMMNLLSNAFKFTFEGGISVSVRQRADEGAAEIAVADTGIGIDSAEIPRLFDRFHRVENARGRSFEGSGIGLALVQEIAQLHGGRIEVESAPGKGSVFRVIIPLGSRHLPQDQLARAPDSAVGAEMARAFVEEALLWLPNGEETEGAAARGAGQRVLVAEDNADMRAYIARLLGERGYRVETVGDGQSALEALRAQRPDLLLTDVMMPRLDGFGLLDAIRRDSGLFDLPVILLSARAGEESSVEGLEAGADDYLSKPFSARELLARVSANLALARLRKEATATLEAKTAELQAVLDTAPVAIWFTNDDTAARSNGNLYAAKLFRVDPGVNTSLTQPETTRPTHFFVARQGVKVDPGTLPLVRAVRGEEVRGDELEIHFDDGDIAHLLINASPIKASSGQIIGGVAIGVDVTSRTLAERQRVLLINELNHRVKNTLATVQSIAMQTMRRAAETPDALQRFEARLSALSRAHDLLTAQNWEGASLVEVVGRALDPFNASGDRIALSGPNVRLSPRYALALSMALHELATNAVKYGALSNEAGRVALDWTNGAGGVAITWREIDGPPVSPPMSAGFGTRLLLRALSHDLGAPAGLEFNPDGLVAHLKIPPRSTEHAGDAQ